MMVSERLVTGTALRENEITVNHLMYFRHNNASQLFAIIAGVGRGGAQVGRAPLKMSLKQRRLVAALIGGPINILIS